MTQKTTKARTNAFFKALAETGNQTISVERDEAGEDVPRASSTLSGGQGGLHSLFRAAGYHSTAPPFHRSRVQGADGGLCGAGAGATCNVKLAGAAGCAEVEGSSEGAGKSSGAAGIAASSSAIQLALAKAGYSQP